MTPEEIVHNYWTDVWIRRDLSVLGDLYTDPTMRHTVDGSELLTIDALSDHISEALRSVRGEDFSIDALTVADDLAWVRLTLHGVSLATMSPMTVTWLAQYRLDGGKIAETWALHRANLDWHSR